MTLLDALIAVGPVVLMLAVGEIARRVIRSAVASAPVRHEQPASASTSTSEEPRDIRMSA